MHENQTSPEMRRECDALYDIVKLTLSDAEFSTDEGALATYLHEDEMDYLFEGEVREKHGYDVYHHSGFVAAQAVYSLYEPDGGFSRRNLVMIIWKDSKAYVELSQGTAHLFHYDNKHDEGAAEQLDTGVLDEYVIKSVKTALLQLHAVI